MLLVFSACQIWTLFTSHLHMYMSSAYYLSICVLCTYYLQWSFICSSLTDNANVIYMSSLLLFIDPMMYNLVSIQCLHKHTLSMPSTCCMHIYTLFVMYLTFLIYLITCNLVSAYCLHTHMSSAHHLYVICTATHGQHGPELSFTVTGICY